MAGAADGGRMTVLLVLLVLLVLTLPYLALHHRLLPESTYL
jgi:hypothetical protein